MKNRSKELSEAHWKYLQDLLRTHEVEEVNIKTIGFHYKSAFVHGYGHGVEDVEKKG